MTKHIPKFEIRVHDAEGQPGRWYGVDGGHDEALDMARKWAGNGYIGGYVVALADGEQIMRYVRTAKGVVELF